MVERVDGPTPNGGVYSQIYYYDADGNRVENPEDAEKVFICEFDSDDNMIHETFLIR